MKNNFKNILKIIVLGVLLSSATIFAASWSTPTAPSPTNKPTPVNLGASTQIKTDAFGLNSGLAVLGTGAGSAVLADTVSSMTANAKFYVSGKIGIGNPTPSEALDISGNIKTSSLAHVSGPNLQEVCVDSAGVLYLCGIQPTGLPPACTGSATFSSPGTYTFTTSYCATSINIKAWGAGGGGGGGAGAPALGQDGGGGGGGSGGGYTTRQIAVVPFQSFTVTIGTGGTGAAGGPAGSNAGGNKSCASGGCGTTSSFSGASVSMNANGGQYGGGAPYGSGQGGSSQPGGTASGGTTNATGSTGDNGFSSGGGCNGAGGAGAGPSAGGSGGGGTGGSNRCDAGAGAPGNTGGWGVGGGGGAGGKSGTGAHSGGGGGNGGNGRVEISW